MTLKSKIGPSIGYLFPIILVLFVVFTVNKCNRKKAEKERVQAIADSILLSNQRNFVPPPPPEYPKSGEMTIYADEPGKAWLDPKKTYRRPTGPVTYTFVKDQSVIFYDTASNQKLNVNNDKWTKWYPAGEYLITPYKRDSIYFRWWQKN